MRRMISDKQLNELASKNLKIIELDKSITNATITQEQLDIIFPKDTQGNIHKPDYDIVIVDDLGTAYESFYYLQLWGLGIVRFSRFDTDSYYTAYIRPNNTKFTQTKTEIATKEYVDNLLMNGNHLK